MKKSIFLFFAAILCAMTANAKMVYLKPGNWFNDGADVWVHSWGSGTNITGKLQAINELGLYGLEIGNNTSCLFVRQSGGQSGINWDSNWYKTGDLTISDDKRCYHIGDWEPTGWIAVPSAHIAGATELTGHNWSADASDNKMTKQNDGTWTLTKTIASINQGNYEYKVTDGTWVWSLGKSATENATIKIPATGKYNVTFTYTPSSNTVSAEAKQLFNISATAGAGGTVSGTNGDYEKGSTASFTANANDGYKFVNWTKGGVEVSTDATYSFTATENVDLVANFVPATATITLVDAEERGANLTLSADEYAVGDEITASAAIYDDDLAFAYWKEGDVIVSYSADYTFIVEGDRTLEAYFGNNMPVEMADLVVDADAMTITGSNTTDGVTASLKLDEYDSDMDLWSIDASASSITYSGSPLTVLYGEVWLDMDAFSMAMAKVVTTYDEELFVFNLEMTAATETLEVGVATELSLEFGALVMRGTWYDENEVEYPFEAQVGGFDYTKAEQECMTTVSLGNFDDDTNWLGMAQETMTVTVADGTVELTGTVTTMWPINTLNVVAQGMIEILDLNLDATVEEMDLGVDGKYLHLTAVDDEVSGMDFDLYLNDYTGADGEYELNEMSTVAGGAAAATGSLTKSGNTYTGTLYAAAGTLYVFDLTLTEFVPTYDNISLTGLTGQAEARYMGWGSEYYLALNLEGTWSDGTETYPVLLEITVFIIQSHL